MNTPLAVPRLRAFVVAAACIVSAVAGAESAIVEAYLAGDYARARQDWSVLAEQGDPVAQYNLAMLFIQGLGVPREPQRALPHLRRAASAGYPPAQYELGLALLPDGPDPARAAAAFWLERSARQGHPMAAWRLGRLLAEADGASRSEEALAWLRRAEEAGIEGATDSLRTLEDMLPGGEVDDGGDVRSGLTEGRGTLAQRQAFFEGQKAFIRQDYAEAVRVWSPLAEAGMARAQYGIAFMLESGWGVVQDYAEAAYWYQLAAQKGHRKAQFNLGKMYLDGRGIAADRGAGLYWVQTAADAGEPRARDLMSRLK